MAAILSTIDLCGEQFFVDPFNEGLRNTKGHTFDILFDKMKKTPEGRLRFFYNKHLQCLAPAPRKAVAAGVELIEILSPSDMQPLFTSKKDSKAAIPAAKEYQARVLPKITLAREQYFLDAPAGKLLHWQDPARNIPVAFTHRNFLHKIIPDYGQLSFEQTKALQTAFEHLTQYKPLEKLDPAGAALLKNDDRCFHKKRTVGHVQHRKGKNYKRPSR